MSSGGQSRIGASACGCCQRNGGNGGNGGNGKNGGNGGKGGEESPDLRQVAQTMGEVAKQLGDIAKALASSAGQEEDPDLRQKVTYKLRELICNVCAGAGNDLDLACLLRCLNCVGAGSSE